MRILSMLLVTVFVLENLLLGTVYAAEAIDIHKTPIVRANTVKKGDAYIPGGTVLEAEVTRNVSSHDFRTGDQLPLRLAENLYVNDVLVAPRGTRIESVITKARRSGGFGIRGKLEFHVVSMRTLNGVEIPLQREIKKKGESDNGAVAVGLFVSLLGGAFMKGRNSSIPQGTRFTVEVTEDTDLDTPLNQLAEAMDSYRSYGVSVRSR
ncbi:hypothetical protein [Selenomonas ruminantium]|uniref:Uncharacterized protein n=1 Tax=Selenomonas ruminantium TaxID=971 RepID=A0A1H0PMX9_SELRU|nr:hypothetical protein [Selenomonas ruminantium]SDP05936.1 hypothetical protein SAMN05216366_10594 [Selenomonas ruminantium]